MSPNYVPTTKSEVSVQNLHNLQWVGPIKRPPVLETASLSKKWGYVCLLLLCNQHATYKSRLPLEISLTAIILDTLLAWSIQCLIIQWNFWYRVWSERTPLSCKILPFKLHWVWARAMSYLVTVVICGAGYGLQWADKSHTLGKRHLQITVFIVGQISPY